MYSDRLAIAVQSNGKVLREFGDTVYLPFGTEYSLLIKNLNTVRCVVNISIDGEDIASGGSFVVPANGSINIERFLSNNNLLRGNRFKFIERTDSISEYRGNKIDDGLIRIEYEFEKINYRPMWQDFDQELKRSLRSNTTNIQYSNNTLPLSAAPMSATSLSADAAASMSAAQTQSTATASYLSNTSHSLNDTGITTKGSISEQRFVDVGHISTDGNIKCMVIRLKGETAGQPVKQAVTVKSKSKCSTCGRVNKSSAKFCTNCGTSLTII